MQICGSAAIRFKITGAKPGASLSPSDFTFSTGEFGSQLKVLDLSAASHNPAQEWSGASISINAVPPRPAPMIATCVPLAAPVLCGRLGDLD